MRPFFPLLLVLWLSVPEVCTLKGFPLFFFIATSRASDFFPYFFGGKNVTAEVKMFGINWLASQGCWAKKKRVGWDMVLN